MHRVPTLRAPTRSAMLASMAGLILGLPLGCNGDKTPTGTNEAAEQAPPDPTPPPDLPQPPELAENTFVRPSKDELAAQKAALQRHLDAGRTAVKAGDYEAGIAELMQAATINPMHAKTLGELGWAYFNAGKLERARAVLDKGLHHADDPQTRGAILYNLGRVAEAQGQKMLASELYQRSLAVRPHEAVAARLAALTGGMEVVSHSECDWVEHGPAPRHLCHAYVQKLELDHPSEDPSERPECVYESTRPLTTAEAGPDHPAGESSEVTVFDLVLDPKHAVAVFSYRDYEMYVEVFVLNVVIDGAWYSTHLTFANHPGVGYADENLDEIELTTQQLAPGGLPEVVVEWSMNGHDMDPGVEMEELWSSKNMAVFGVQSGDPRWMLALTTESSNSYDEMDNDDPESNVESVEIEWQPKTGELEVSRTKHEPSAPVGRFALGTYPQLCPVEIDSY